MKIVTLRTGVTTTRLQSMRMARSLNPMTDTESFTTAELACELMLVDATGRHRAFAASFEKRNEMILVGDSSQERCARGTLIALAFVCASLFPLAAHAELWGYIDAAGVAHVAQMQLDSRYHLVLRPDRVTSQRVRGKTDRVRDLLTWLEFAPEVRALKSILLDAARQEGVDVELLTAVITVESGFKARAVSPRGAIGLMQLMPDTADRYASKAELQVPAAQRLLDPRTNVLTGARMLADLTRRFGTIDLVLAAWNAGEGTVRHHGGGMPPIDETRAHVQLVLELYWPLLQNSLVRHAKQINMQGPVAARREPSDSVNRP